MAKAIRALIWILLIILVTPVLVIGLWVGIAVGVFSTSSEQHQDQDAQAEATVEYHKNRVMQEQQATLQAVRIAEAHTLCEPIVTLYCARSSDSPVCDTKEIEYLCLTDDSITPQNYRQVIRKFHHKQNRARNESRIDNRHYESGRDWFWL